MDTSSSITPTSSRKPMGADVFVSIWRSWALNEIEEEWGGFVTIKDKNIVEFSNIEVFSRIITPKVNYNLANLSFLNCKFSTFKIENKGFSELHISDRTLIEDLIIDESVVDKIIIEDDSKIKLFRLQGNLSRIEYLDINKSSIDTFLLKRHSIIDSFCINNNSKVFIVSQESKIINLFVRSSNISLSDSNSQINNIGISLSLADAFSFKHSNIGKILIENSQLNDFIIEDSSVIEANILYNTRIRYIQLSYSKINLLKIYHENFIEIFICRLPFSQPSQLIFHKSDFVTLDFDNSIFPEFTTLNISECRVNKLKISNFCNYGTIFFSAIMPLKEWYGFKQDENSNHVIIEKSSHPDFKNGEYKFEKIDDIIVYPTTINLCDSSLGKVQFINCDLSMFDRFEFSNTKMLDVFVAGSQMPGDKAFCLPDNEHPHLEIAEQKRLAYGQFKKIYEAQGDVAGSLPYLAYEMEAYRNQLMQEKTRPRFSKGWWCDKKAWDNRGERVTLWLNKISTGYGNNWVRGLVATLVSIFVCHSIFLWAIDCKIGNPFKWDDWKEAARLYSYAPHFVNPLRDNDSIILVENEDLLTPFARLWDFFSRIIVAYFAYQTIQAFRKLGKSSG